ncbi:MAG: LD-carboxypeptidase [Deltaproteobacteria bacterium]|nr:LD-carboxypeptidase [Deltaproteobacteria bacterium]
MSEWIHPPAAPAAKGPGGPVLRVVSPAGPVERRRVEASISFLEAAGYRVLATEGIYSATDYLAGDDARRLAELQDALDDPEVDVVWAARGGYGTMRLLPELSLERLLAAPKIVAGFSDITALHAALGARGLVSLHSCVLAGVAEQQPEDRAALLAILAGETPPPLALEGPVIVPGQAAGRVLGGNLSVLTRLVGTPYLPSLSGALLLLEDVGERPYRLDRMLTHLELAGVPGQLAGVIVGEHAGCEEPGGGLTALEVITERLSRWGLPAMAGAPVGHGKWNRAIPLGVTARLDTTTATLTFAGPAFPLPAPQDAPA